MSWRRGSKCYEGDCVEAQELPGGGLIAMRDSGDPKTVVLITKAAWRVFTDGVKDGEFDSFGEGAGL